MKRNSILFLLIFASLFANAKQKKEEHSSAVWSLKFSPLGLFEPDQAISLATEVRVKPRLGIQLEASYIFNTLYLASDRVITNTRGTRIVPEIRYYDISFKRNVQRYIGLQISFKYVEKDVEQWVNKTNYRQLETFHLRKNNVAAIFMGGIQNHAHRIGYDLNIGIGAKYKTMNDTYTPKDITPFSEHYGEALGGYYPTLSATFKLCYRILE